MGREVRRVPANWQHPREEIEGRWYYKPLYGGSFSALAAKWDKGNEKWNAGLRWGWEEATWIPIEPEYQGITFNEWDGSRPKERYYMPDWPEEQRTHYQMYETCTEGTPISPVMRSPEELARWLTRNNASAFADQTASYDDWLSIARGGGSVAAVTKVDEEGSIILENGVKAYYDAHREEETARTVEKAVRLYAGAELRKFRDELEEE